MIFLMQACQNLALYDERYTKLRALAKAQGTTNSKLEGKLEAEKNRADAVEESFKSQAKELKKAQTEIKKSQAELKKSKDSS